jgi:hypothetical protein
MTAEELKEKIVRSSPEQLQVVADLLFKIANTQLLKSEIIGLTRDVVYCLSENAA